MQTARILFVICKIIGFGLLFANWIESGRATGFFPIIALGILTMLRYRFPKCHYTLVMDVVILLILEQQLVLSIFVISELFLQVWESERTRGLKLRDQAANRYYELEQMQGDLLTATAQIERMTAVSERARIASEIHDNAGHEMIGAYISLQTVRGLLAENISHEEKLAALELYDQALEKLDSGVNKIREAVHNLAPARAIGVELLQETCNRFSICQVAFASYGDLSVVPIYCWNLLEACLNESLTNIVRHADAKQVKVTLDATRTIIRLCIENDGLRSSHRTSGIGLRNLRHRAATIGGNLSVVDEGNVFRVICVIPIKEQ